MKRCMWFISNYLQFVGNNLWSGGGRGDSFINWCRELRVVYISRGNKLFLSFVLSKKLCFISFLIIYLPELGMDQNNQHNQKFNWFCILFVVLTDCLYTSYFMFHCFLGGLDVLLYREIENWVAVSFYTIMMFMV